MKGLLHSKRFRTNLYKWLFMYVGVMLLLTTVITYSKYMTSLNQSGEMIPAKFKVKIDCLNVEDSDVCTNGSFKLNHDIEYYFSVNTDEVEVLADIYVSVFAEENFKIIDVQRVDSLGNSLNQQNDGITIKMDDLKGQISMRTKQNGTTYYKIIVKYVGKDYMSAIPSNKIVTVGYSARQIVEN